MFQDFWTPFYNPWEKVVLITHDAVVYLLVFLDELHLAHFTDCTGSCLLLVFSTVHIQYCGKWLKNWDGKTWGALGMMVREERVCIQKSQLFYLQWSVMPFFWARVMNVWINFWQNVSLYCCWVVIAPELGWLPPEYSLLSSPFERVSVVQKLVFFLSEEEGIVLLSKVNTVLGKRSLPLPSKGQGINFPANLSRALPCNAEVLIQGCHDLQRTLDQVPSSHWFLWRSALLCSYIFSATAFVFVYPLPQCPGTH